MMNNKLAEELWDSWECGNQSYVRKALRNKSKAWILNFIHYAIEERQLSEKYALAEVARMVFQLILIL